MMSAALEKAFDHFALWFLQYMAISLNLIQFHLAFSFSSSFKYMLHRLIYHFRLRYSSFFHSGQNSFSRHFENSVSRVMCF